MSADLDVLSLIQDQSIRNTVLNDMALHFLCDGVPDKGVCNPCTKSASIMKIAALFSDSSSSFGKWPDILKKAAQLNHIGCMDMFLRNCKIDQLSRPDQYYILAAACENGHTDMVKLLMINGIRIDGPTTGSRVSALSIACEKGYADIVELLLKEIDRPGARPMHVLYKIYAVERAAPDSAVIALLVESYKRTSTKIQSRVIDAMQIPALIILLRCPGVTTILKFDTDIAEYFNDDGPWRSGSGYGYGYFENILIRFVSNGSYEGVDLLYTSQDPIIRSEVRPVYNGGILYALVEAASKNYVKIVDRMLDEGVDPFETYCPDYEHKYDQNRHNEYYVFKQLASKRADPTIVLKILGRGGCGYSRKKVLRILMNHEYMHRAIIETYIIKKEDDCMSDCEKYDESKSDGCDSD